MKKLFAILMSIMMIACFMPTMAFAANLSGSVTIEGTAKFGQTLTANVTKVTGNGAEELKYQWKRGDADIDNATTNTYTLVSDDIGKNVKVTVKTASDTTGLTSEAVTVKKADGSAISAELTGVPPKTADGKGKITGTNTTMEYNTTSDAEDGWNGCSAGETEVAAGKYYVRIKATTAANAGPTKEVTVPPYVAPVKLTGSVAIEGNAKFGQTLTANVTKVTGNGAEELKYQWKRGDADIDNATTNTYTLVSDDIGKNVKVTVKTASDTTGLTSEAVTVKKADGSAISAELTGVAPEAAEGKGKITGTEATMEYNTTSDAEAGWKDCSAKETEVAAGKYYVRIKATETTNAGPTKEVTVLPYVAPVPTATATVSGNKIVGETKVTLAQQTIVITLANGPTFKGDVEGLDVSKWFAKDNLPKGLTAKITNVNDNKKSATITLSGIPTVKSEADILITIPQNSLEGAAANMPVNMQGAKYAIKEFYMPTGGGGGGAAAKPAKPTTPEQKPATAAGKTAANTAITTAASANKYDKAEQAEVDQIVKDAEAKIKEAKTEDEVKAIQKDAEAKLDKILTTEEKATIASLKEVSKRDFGTKSKKITKKNGKKAVNLSWAAPEGVDVDGYEIFRSTKKNSGYGTEPYFETPKTSYTNSKGLKSGKTYYYKVRAYVEINGERHYTDYSTNASRKI